MKQLIQDFENLPQLYKLILALPVFDLIWGIYRLCKSIDEKYTLGIILDIVLYLIASPVMCILDIIFIIKDNKVWWIEENHA